MKNIGIIMVISAFTLIALTGCEQEKAIYNGPSYLMFSDTLYSLPVTETNDVFNVEVVATRSADYDRTFAVEVVTNRSNAIEGKHYRILSHTATIKAGEMVANVPMQGVYENIEVDDSLGFTLRLIIPEEEQWDMYGTRANVVLYKSCPFDIHNFTGWCRVTSTYYMQYLSNVSTRLIKSELAGEEENTILLRDYYYEGYDVKIKLDTEDFMEPFVDMKEQVVGNTGEAFGTTYGDGKLLMSAPAGYTSYFSTCENFILHYAKVSVDNKDGSEFGTVGVFLNLIEWISDAEAEQMKEQGY